MAKEHTLMQKLLKNLNKKTIMTVTCAAGNTIIQVLAQNNQNFIVSTGIAGFKGAKRSTPQAAQDSAQIAGKKLRERKLRKIILIFKGLSRTRKSVLKGLKKRHVIIERILDKTSIAHNGCRAKKRRRK